MQPLEAILTLIRTRLVANGLTNVPAVGAQEDSYPFVTFKLRGSSTWESFGKTYEDMTIRFSVTDNLPSPLRIYTTLNTIEEEFNRKAQTIIGEDNLTYIGGTKLNEFCGYQNNEYNFVGTADYLIQLEADVVAWDTSSSSSQSSSSSSSHSSSSSSSASTSSSSSESSISSSSSSASTSSSSSDSSSSSSLSSESSSSSDSSSSSSESSSSSLSSLSSLSSQSSSSSSESSSSESSSSKSSSSSSMDDCPNTVTGFDASIILIDWE